VSSTTRQGTSGKIEVKKLNMECDIDENFKDVKGFVTVFTAIMFRFELRAKNLNKNVFYRVKI
jgi:hypothetical protein